MSASDYLEDKILNHVCRQASFTMPGALYMALHSADPGDTGGDELTTAGSYTRKACSGDFGTTASGSPSSIVNDGAITFGAASADWNGGNRIEYFSLWDSGPAPGSGNCLVIGTLTTTATTPKVLNGQTAEFAVGDAKVKCS